MEGPEGGARDVGSHGKVVRGEVGPTGPSIFSFCRESWGLVCVPRGGEGGWKIWAKTGAEGFADGVRVRAV
jgi:hypothetical protein